MNESVDQYNAYRNKMNDRIFSVAQKVVKRIFNVVVPHKRRAVEILDNMHVLN